MTITTEQVYKVLDHLMTGRGIAYTEKDLKEGTCVSQRDLRLALIVLPKLRLIEKVRKGYKFKKNSANGKAFLTFYNAILKEIMREIRDYQEKHEVNE